MKQLAISQEWQEKNQSTNVNQIAIKNQQRINKESHG